MLKTKIQEGWPQYKCQVMPCLQHYWDFKDELALLDEVVFKKNKIPTSLRAVMMTAVHQPHLGMEASKRRARAMVY